MLCSDLETRRLFDLVLLRDQPQDEENTHEPRQHDEAGEGEGSQIILENLGGGGGVRLAGQGPVAQRVLHDIPANFKGKLEDEADGDDKKVKDLPGLPEKVKRAGQIQVRM